MQIESIKVGYLKTNCYILSINSDVLLIDPGDEYDKIKKQIGMKNLVGIIITHNHFDHIGALKEFMDNYKVDKYDYDNLKEGNNKIGPFEFEIIYTPGHTNDSITIYFEKEKVMFVGDFVFKDTVGRTDLPTGNFDEMLSSIRKIKEYPDVKIYPGHGIDTTLEYEKNNNDFFR